MKLAPWSPARDLLKIQDEMNRMVDRFFNPDEFFGSEFSAGWLPSMDVMETKDSFKLTLELPGMKKDDVRITYKDDTLIVEGERKQEEESKDVNYHRVERRYGKFLRSFHIPTQVKSDQIEARFKDGVLTIEVPKTEEVKAKEIPVKVS